MKTALCNCIRNSPVLKSWDVCECCIFKEKKPKKIVRVEFIEPRDET
jgi:hypothetical protein